MRCRLDLCPAIRSWPMIVDHNRQQVIYLYSRISISRTRLSRSLRIWIQYTFWLLSPTIVWRLRLFYESKLPEVQIKLHSGNLIELVKNSPHNFEISRVDCIYLLFRALDKHVHEQKFHIKVWQAVTKHDFCKYC